VLNDQLAVTTAEVLVVEVHAVDAAAAPSIAAKTRFFIRVS
jgi:hypothetical protein